MNSMVFKSGSQMDIIYTDFAKSFDTMNHDTIYLQL